MGVALIGREEVEMEWGEDKNDTYLKLPVRTRVGPIAVRRTGGGRGRHETRENER